MRLAIVTLFPEMFDAVARYGVTGRAVEEGQLELYLCNPRDHATDRHGTVDDRPYGGGPGMLMKVDTLEAAIAEARGRLAAPGRVIYLSPQGRRFDHELAKELAAEPGMVLVAGRYEGVDERLLQRSAGSCPASWATRNPQSRIPLRTACWIVRTTRDPRRTGVDGCRKYCSAAITG